MAVSKRTWKTTSGEQKQAWIVDDVHQARQLVECPHMASSAVEDDEQAPASLCLSTMALDRLDDAREALGDLKDD